MAALDIAYEWLRDINEKPSFADITTLCHAVIDAHEKGEWQPIETAPRQLDNKNMQAEYILILYDGDKEKVYRITMGFWNENIKQWECCDDYAEDINPTHWMPLPAPQSARPVVFKM